MNPCARIGCEQVGEWRPVLRLHPKRPPRNYSRENGIRVELKMDICGTCRDGLKPEDFISDQGWQQILDGVRPLKRAEPERRTVELLWIPLVASRFAGEAQKTDPPSGRVE